MHPSPLCLHRRRIRYFGYTRACFYFFLFFFIFHRLFIEGIRPSATFYLGIIRFCHLKEKKKRYFEYLKTRRKSNAGKSQGNHFFYVEIFIYSKREREWRSVDKQTERAILIPELLPFYSNFLAFKPSKRVYLRNIIAEERCAALR